MHRAIIASMVVATLAVGGCGASATPSSKSSSDSPTIKYVSAPTVTLAMGSSAMEPTIHCARPSSGCKAAVSDRLVVKVSGAGALKRGDIVVFQAPLEAVVKCGAGGRFAQRLIGLPGDIVREDDRGFVHVDGEKLDEPYVPADARAADTTLHGKTWRVPAGEYFFVGDNRADSCDSRAWGSVPADDVYGVVVKIIRTR